MYLNCINYLKFCLEYWNSGGIINWLILFFSCILFYFVLKLKNNKNFLNCLINVFPSLGLLGTVIGMINTFSIIATGNIDKISEGISIALITTLSGLFISLIGMFLVSFKK